MLRAEDFSRALLAGFTERTRGHPMPPDVRVAVDTYASATVDLLQAMLDASNNVVAPALVQAVESAARAQLAAGEAMRDAVARFILEHVPAGTAQ